MTSGVRTDRRMELISRNALMLVRQTCLIAVAPDTTECRCVVTRVTLRAVIPFIRVLMLCAAINRKANRCVDVMACAERRRGIPHGLCMTYGAIVVQTQCRVVRRSRRGRVFRLMTLITH